MKRLTKSFRVNPELWTRVKIHCAKNSLDLSSFLETALEEKLRRSRESKY